MMRMTIALLAGLVGAATAAAAGSVDGTWRFTFSPPVERVTFLFNFTTDADGTLKGDLVDAAPELRFKPTLDDVRLRDNTLHFTLKIASTEFNFEGLLPKMAGERMLGSMAFRNNLLPATLYPSKLKSLKDRATLAREILESADHSEVLDLALEELTNASESKLTEEDVRSILDRLNKASEPSGPRWARMAALRSARILANETDFTPLAVAQARRAERMLSPNDDPQAQLQLLEGVADVYRKAKKKEELEEILNRVAKLEERDYEQYQRKATDFVTERFAGRKGKGDQSVLVELFTGAECPPCVAADMAFDGLAKTFSPRDVTLLQYHLHIPRPDPLTSPASEERSRYYGDKVEGTPAIFFNGKADSSGGGPAAAAAAKLKEYREIIEPVLEKTAGAQLTVSGSRTEEEILIKASVSDLQNPGEKVRLRLALAEEVVRFTGGNGLRYHHHVVRYLPGGAQGVALTEATKEIALKTSLAEVRKSIEDYLENFSKENDVTFPLRPLNLKNLIVVAFIQNDATGEVIQSAQALVK